MNHFQFSKRGLLLAFSALAALVVVVACGGGGGDTTTASSDSRSFALSAEKDRAKAHENDGGSAVNWTPVSVADTANPGSRQDIPVTFKTAIALKDVTVSVAELNEFITVSPTSFTTLEAGQTATVTITVAPPAGAAQGPPAALGTMDGTIHLRSGNSTIARPLPVTLTLVLPELINGIAVPPEPPADLNNATLAGFDANGNGVRDDVDRSIAKAFGGTPDYAFVLPYARAYQALLTSPTPATRDAALGKYSTVVCATHGASLPVMSFGMTQLVVNTNIRKTARSKFADVLLGFSPEELTPCAK